jgi:hypothetical protein
MKTIISFVLALILLTSAAWAQGVIVVQNRPGDVPCGALKKNPNRGTWTVNRTLGSPETSGLNDFFEIYATANPVSVS